MKHRSLAILALVATSAAHSSDIDNFVMQSRDAAKTLGEGLKSELMAAIKSGGANEAIQVCNQRAPEISKAVSTEKNLIVGRTSLKTRNSGNRPDTWERKVLEQFEARKNDGEDAAVMEHYELAEYNGKPAMRYMKPIVTGKPCLMCHGEQIPETLQDKIAALYPEDSATGFRLGDIRGAFTIVRPVQIP